MTKALHLFSFIVSVTVIGYLLATGDYAVAVGLWAIGTYAGSGYDILRNRHSKPK